jgi:formamidopyrimidine-DNA glycosylase
MPELPEVEVVRRDLDVVLRGRTIVSVEIGRTRAIRREADADRFVDALAGRVVAGTARVGKFLVLQLVGDGGGEALVVHLGMSGQLRLAASADEARLPHTHLVWRLDDGREIRFVDPRTFGQAWHAGPVAAGSRPASLGHLGPDALDELSGPDMLATRLSGRRVAVKLRLMDQTAIAGLGNIYSDEILFRAGVAPQRPSGTLTADEAAALFAATGDVLRAAIEARGSSLADGQYVDAHGRSGSYQDQHAVHARAGVPCRRCGAAIARLRMGGRSASWCPGCQR